MPNFVAKRLRLLNAVGGRVLARRALVPEELIREVVERVGLEDFGGAEFREPLRHLVEALEKEARLSPIGRHIIRSRIAEALENRLRVQSDRLAHPEIGGEEIARPVFIIGPPRSGTTILFHTLAQDPANLTLSQWKLDFPSPPPEANPRPRDARVRRTRQRAALLYGLLPELRPVYTVAATLPNECAVVTAHEFSSVLYSITYDVPSYDAWLLRSDPEAAYRLHRRFLQQLQWRVPEPRWVLKSPGHLLALDALFASYPDARVIQTHRNPVEVLPSLASLTTILRALSSEHVDPARVGPQVSDFWYQALARAHEFRTSHPELADRFVDLGFAEISGDLIGSLHRLYERLGWTLPSEAEHRMRRFLEERGGGMRKPRGEDPLRFGIDAKREAARFAWYLEAHGLAVG
jgi:hypothetical protein